MACFAGLAIIELPVMNGMTWVHIWWVHSCGNLLDKILGMSWMGVLSFVLMFEVYDDD